jgi:hypothetical protein
VGEKRNGLPDEKYLWMCGYHNLSLQLLFHCSTCGPSMRYNRMIVRQQIFLSFHPYDSKKEKIKIKIGT